jgi:NDP-sugar pyrophosphorylase family protein
MANTFFRKIQSNVGLTANTINSYTVQSGVTSIVLGLTLCNTTGATINASVFVNNGANIHYIVKNAPITTGGALVPIGGDQKLVLQFNDNVKVQSDTVNSIDAFMSIMEIT